MRDSGVTRVAVLSALRATPGLTLSENADAGVTIIKGTQIDVIFLDEPIEKKMLFRLEARYNTPIHWFYRADMIPQAIYPARPH